MAEPTVVDSSSNLKPDFSLEDDGSQSDSEGVSRDAEEVMSELVAIDIDGVRYLAWKSALEKQVDENRIISVRKAAYCGGDCCWCRGCKLAASQEWLEERRTETGRTKCPMCRCEDWMRFEILQGGAKKIEPASAHSSDATAGTCVNTAAKEQ